METAIHLLRCQSFDVQYNSSSLSFGVRNPTHVFKEAKENKDVAVNVLIPFELIGLAGQLFRDVIREALS